MERKGGKKVVLVKSQQSFTSQCEFVKSDCLCNANLRAICLENRGVGELGFKRRKGDFRAYSGRTGLEQYLE